MTFSIVYISLIVNFNNRQIS